MQECKDHTRKKSWHEAKQRYILECLKDPTVISKEIERSWIVAVTLGYQKLVEDIRLGCYNRTFINDFSNFFYKNIDERPELAELIAYRLVNSTIKHFDLCGQN